MSELNCVFPCAAHCARPRCASSASLTQAPALNTILAHLGEPTMPPELARARGPPLWDPLAEPASRWHEAPAPLPEFVFDQPLSW